MAPFNYPITHITCDPVQQFQEPLSVGKIRIIILFLFLSSCRPICIAYIEINCQFIQLHFSLSDLIFYSLVRLYVFSFSFILLLLFFLILIRSHNCGCLLSRSFDCLCIYLTCFLFDAKEEEEKKEAKGELRPFATSRTGRIHWFCFTCYFLSPLMNQKYFTLSQQYFRCVFFY